MSSINSIIKEERVISSNNNYENYSPNKAHESDSIMTRNSRHPTIGRRLKFKNSDVSDPYGVSTSIQRSPHEKRVGR